MLVSAGGARTLRAAARSPPARDRVQAPLAAVPRYRTTLRRRSPGECRETALPCERLPESRQMPVSCRLAEAAAARPVSAATRPRVRQAGKACEKIVRSCSADLEVCATRQG